ncbi:transcriptional regulator, GntR family [Clostridium collagenovorans DSM 3089]|uniref:Transcriptional regulator, GntR family n=1 Tax=Clostridium collagenovorans DSM 3089 TaxID=1121306 RepID=A0A1M5XIY4_9CLOT|nr:GntR family transcriptional regulator [Clostridium collagenovorans]SHH99592.1 transcriptional regulator, GntR family [Clostridium collagenovorans DSM 3089]
MLIVIDFESEEPIYQQLKNSIMKGILTNELKEGESLPSVREMASDIGVNMHTVNKTYNLLKEDGLINIDRRKGAIVSKDKQKPTEEYKAKLKSNLDNIIVESSLRGINEEEFLDICKELYNQYTV